ncbi:MAG: Ni/Fe-hydrogenase, b-type cytochrome subunit [Campylobacteraceae bacterium]|jgi:Ni/Fe-hydrogenase 1 B-type cytochrome subunit|nr:Ni/Fe-hydrogenase, b-type cytochrome subunit [Campylobacteraceae bacterium]
MSKELLAREAETEYTASTRWVHWIRFFSIIALTVTGFYIAYVFAAPEISSEPTLFLHAKIRMVHEIFGFLLIAVTIYKSYIFFFDKSKVEKLEINSAKDVVNFKIWIAQIKYYLFLGEHPKLKGAYNPLQFAAYVLLYIMIALLSLTGLILYVHIYHDGLGGVLYPLMRWFEAVMGGLANVRVIHHIAMWIVLIFVPVHVYMVIFNAIKGKEGALDAIVSGLKFKHKNH